MASGKESTSKPKVGSRKAAEAARAAQKEAASAPAQGGGAYTVLARKYRPQTFEDLVGQDAMVRTLSNAFSSGRIAQAYMLTGVRGVGKTTTARILARALNYEGPKGDNGPSLDMPELGEHCAEIMASRHIDVLEMDAASNTGIDDVREIIESSRYKPARARYKVYIIDEVHMLSKAAFNGLLKTLEEPPEHVKFIFATTEVRKVPVTVLSRCQRFDLRRIDVETLMSHFKNIAELEGNTLSDEALALIARAAQGSVRDGLSLLDQAIAHASGSVEAADVRAMLGLAERGRVFDLLESVLGGDAAGAIATLDALYADGAEPSEIVADLADAVHVVSRVKAAGEKLADPTSSEAERTRAAALAERLGMAQLARAWQMLLKGYGEVQAAPRAIAAAEMVLVRLAYAADLPSPAEAIAQAGTEDGPAGEVAGPSTGTPAATAPIRTSSSAAAAPAAAPEVMDEPADEPRALHESEPALVLPDSFAAVAVLARENRDLKLCRALEEQVSLVRFGEGRIELRLLEGAPQGLANELGAKLERWTGKRWMVSISDDTGEETLASQARAQSAAEREEIERHPAVRAVFEHFPDARIADVRPSSEDGETDMDGTQDDDG
jgi:DNA polymerase-3 subunit gamma/tau